MTDILSMAAAAGNHIRFEDLGLSKVALDLGFFTIKWYSLAYIAGILIGWWYLLQLLKQPGGKPKASTRATVAGAPRCRAIQRRDGGGLQCRHKA